MSWEDRSDVELYGAEAVKTSGNQVHNCTSTGSTCQVSALDCGETYNFTVRAYSQGCSSQASSIVSIQTGVPYQRTHFSPSRHSYLTSDYYYLSQLSGELVFSEPCQPVITSAQTVCNTTEVQISWHQTPGVVNYTVAAAGNLGYTSIHNTTQNLLIAAFPCGQEYNVTVQGRGGQCNSPLSNAVFFKSGMILKLISQITNKNTFVFKMHI